MDTTHLANTAEDLISHKLQRAGLLVAKPKFDRDGADLLVFMSVNQGTKFCCVQCKGRSLIHSNSSNVKVFKSYVTEVFMLFLFINNGNDSVTDLFCFFANEIKTSWKLKTFKDSSKDYYQLTFSKSTYKNQNSGRNLLIHSLNDKKINALKEIIRTSDSKREFKKVLGLMKKQNDLINQQKKLFELEKLINRLKHIDEVSSLLNDKIKIMEDYAKVIETQIDKEESKSNKK